MTVRQGEEEGWEIVFVSLCVHYGMPSIPPLARGWQHGNSCSPVTAETREMLDIKKMTYSTSLRVFMYVLYVCTCRCLSMALCLCVYACACV